jgi:putative SOS response-associated peptidase YedK
MCNLYSITKAQDAMRALFRVVHDRTGNLPPMPGVFPDYPAPIVRMGEGERELTMARWGMPSPAFTLKGRTTDSGVTNVRKTSSPHWRRWLGPANRCIVPFTSFSEYERTAIAHRRLGIICNNLAGHDAMRWGSFAFRKIDVRQLEHGFHFISPYAGNY